MFPRKLNESNKHIPNNDEYYEEYEISDAGYGKDSVKLLHVHHDGPLHIIKELEVNTHLKLYSKKDYIKGKLFIFLIGLKKNGTKQILKFIIEG